MEHQLWTAIVALIATLDKTPNPTRKDFPDAVIAQTYYWAVLHDRPLAWACDRRNWPPHRRSRRLPVPSTLSRRLRSASVRQLLQALDDRLVRPARPGLVWILDGKPLVIGGCSKDPHAGYGRAAAGKAKGYKLHALVAATGGIRAWRLAPMNTDERVMAARMLRAVGPTLAGYLVADANYDSNPLHAICTPWPEVRFLPRRRGRADAALGHRRHQGGRVEAIARINHPFPAFITQLFADRTAIERAFGNLVNWGGGLTGLPAWVRTYPRVHRWVQAKLVLTACKHKLAARTCVS